MQAFFREAYTRTAATNHTEETKKKGRSGEKKKKERDEKRECGGPLIPL